jgi:hypothetical protein
VATQSPACRSPSPGETPKPIGWFRRLVRRACPSFGQLAAGFSLTGFAGLSFLLGAAVMHFDLPFAESLRKAFSGGQAWYARGKSPPPPVDQADAPRGVTVYRPDKAWDGLTLYTNAEDSAAFLLDMRGNIIHRWQLPFRKAWPRPKRATRPLPDGEIHWIRAHLFPNGDLLAVYHTDFDTPHGYGLAKLNRDSELLWTYSGNVHHDIDVAEDGRIFALTHETVKDRPDGLDFIAAPFLADFVVVLSPEGKELKKVPLLEAFRDSPFALILAALKDPNRRRHSFGLDHPALVQEPGDMLHANSIKVLPKALAKKFPLFKAGQVLLSFRSLDAIAVLDMKSGAVVWAAQGVWVMQHDAQFLENGRVLLYDNLGSSQGTRVLEYDPVTQAVPWSYASELSSRFIAFTRGGTQRLPNDNTLIIDAARGRLFEVTPKKELVWECFCEPSDRSPRPGAMPATVVSGAWRYDLSLLTFLKGTDHGKP